MGASSLPYLQWLLQPFQQALIHNVFSLEKNDPKSEDDVPNGYGFFHFVFATEAMYFAMLSIGWNTHHPMKKWTIDVGWTSTLVRVVNQWLAVCVYCKYPKKQR